MFVDRFSHMHSKLAHPASLTKPHIFKHNGKWICKTRDFRGRAAKPVTAYRDWERMKKWVLAGRPGLKGVSRGRLL